MFGGRGIYQGDLMFALEAGGELYLKTDAETVGIFRDLGSMPFTFRSRDGRTTVTSYWRLPDAAHDDGREAQRFGAYAIDAARRTKSIRPGKLGPKGARDRR